MIELHINNNSEKIIVSLNELKTLESPVYLFVFTHIETKQVVKYIINSTEDESLFQYRYNKFPIDTSNIFFEKPIGNYNYDVYEQEDEINEDPLMSTGLVESGKLILYPEDQFEYKQYSTPTLYKTYNG